jgi:hypothetical protein
MASTKASRHRTISPSTRPDITALLENPTSPFEDQISRLSRRVTMLGDVPTFPIGAAGVALLRARQQAPKEVARPTFLVPDTETARDLMDIAAKTSGLDEVAIVTVYKGIRVEDASQTKKPEIVIPLDFGTTIARVATTTANSKNGVQGAIRVLSAAELHALEIGAANSRDDSDPDAEILAALRELTGLTGPALINEFNHTGLHQLQILEEIESEYPNGQSPRRRPGYDEIVLDLEGPPEGYEGWDM